MASKPRTSTEKFKRIQIKEEFDLMTSYLNLMEQELLKTGVDDPPDIKKIAIYYGKASIVFTHIAANLEIYERAKA